MDLKNDVYFTCIMEESKILRYRGFTGLEKTDETGTTVRVARARALGIMRHVGNALNRAF